MGRADPDRPAQAEPAPVEPRLIEAAQMLAFSSVREDVPLQEVTRDLERLSHEAQAADQPLLAAAVLKAQEALVEAADDPVEHRRRARGELSEALVDFVATSTEPAGLDADQRARAAGADQADRARRRPRARRRDARRLPRGSARGDRHGAQAALRELQHVARRSRPADDACGAPSIP